MYIHIYRTMHLPLVDQKSSLYDESSPKHQVTRIHVCEIVVYTRFEDDFKQHTHTHTSAISQSSSKVSPLKRGCGALAKYRVKGNCSLIAARPSGYKRRNTIIIEWEGQLMSVPCLQAARLLYSTSPTYQ